MKQRKTKEGGEADMKEEYGERKGRDGKKTQERDREGRKERDGEGVRVGKVREE